jgi:hypothetical protein
MRQRTDLGSQRSFLALDNILRRGYESRLHPVGVNNSPIGILLNRIGARFAFFSAAASVSSSENRKNQIFIFGPFGDNRRRNLFLPSEIRKAGQASAHEVERTCYAYVDTSTLEKLPDHSDSFQPSCPFLEWQRIFSKRIKVRRYQNKCPLAVFA